MRKAENGSIRLLENQSNSKLLRDEYKTLDHVQVDVLMHSHVLERLLIE
jgi:hypothetical protein